MIGIASSHDPMLEQGRWGGVGNEAIRPVYILSGGKLSGCE